MKKFAIIEEKDRDFIKEDDNMAMDISNAYSSYVSNSAYTTKSNNQKQTTSSNETEKTSTETQASTRKTAADELSYLSNKYSNYSFVAAHYTKGMQYGSSSTVNVAISPQFLSKMASDPELEKEYEKNIAAMQECDEQFTQMQAARGWRVDAQGWAIDKDGGISSWAIVTKDSNAKSHLQTMSENAEKIRKQNDEKKKEKAELEEKRQVSREAKAELEEKRRISREERAELKEKMQEVGKNQLGNKFKDAIIIIRDDEEMDVNKNEKEETTVGINLDMKI